MNTKKPDGYDFVTAALLAVIGLASWIAVSAWLVVNVLRDAPFLLQWLLSALSGVGLVLTGSKIARKLAAIDTVEKDEAKLDCYAWANTSAQLYAMYEVARDKEYAARVKARGY